MMSHMAKRINEMESQTESAKTSKNVNKQPFDPYKPLKNLKHEKLARKIALDPKKTQTEAYLEVYSTDNHLTAKSEASDILSKPNVRERVLALMSKDRPILEKVSENINANLDQRDNLPVNLETCKTVLKVAGALDDPKLAESSFHPVQINFIVNSKQMQHIDTNKVIES